MKRKKKLEKLIIIIIIKRYKKRKKKIYDDGYVLDKSGGIRQCSYQSIYFFV